MKVRRATLSTHKTVPTIDHNAQSILISKQLVNCVWLELKVHDYYFRRNVLRELCSLQ